MIEQIIKEATTSQLIELKEDLLTTWQSSCESELFLELMPKLSAMVADELKSRESSKPSPIKTHYVLMDDAGSFIWHFKGWGGGYATGGSGLDIACIFDSIEKASACKANLEGFFESHRELVKNYKPYPVNLYKP